MGSKVRSSSAPRKAPGEGGYVLHVLPVDEEAVVAVLRVVVVDETCEKPDVGVPLLRGGHCGGAVLRRRQETAARLVRRCSECKWRLRSMTPRDGVIRQLVLCAA